MILEHLSLVFLVFLVPLVPLVPVVITKKEQPRPKRSPTPVHKL